MGYLSGGLQAGREALCEDASSSWTTRRSFFRTYLRFLRGIIDSEDLPLNVSREILQQNKVLNAIRTASVKKVLSELKSIAGDKPEEYVKFVEEYNRLLKEGLYSDFANRETLLELVRVKSTKVDGWTSLAEVKARMKEGQKGIYYITGGAADVLRTSPLLEIYRKKDIEVLILDDEFDEIVFGAVDKYQDVELKAVNKSSAGEDLKDEADSGKDKSEELKPLLEKIKGVLGDKVKDVKASVRLADSPSCIVSDEDEPSHADAADAAGDGPESAAFDETDAGDQSRPRDREEASGVGGRRR